LLVRTGFTGSPTRTISAVPVMPSTYCR
jgi:hypothetical protein